MLRARCRAAASCEAAIDDGVARKARACDGAAQRAADFILLYYAAADIRPPFSPSCRRCCCLPLLRWLFAARLATPLMPRCRRHCHADAAISIALLMLSF